MHGNGSLDLESSSLVKEVVKEQGVEKPGNADNVATCFSFAL